MVRGANKRFKRAEDLFEEKRYREALVLLDDLDREYPDTKNVMYPRALCLAKVGEFSEARAIAERLLEEFDDTRAKRLLERMAAAEKRRDEKRPATAPQVAEAPVQDLLQMPEGPVFVAPDHDLLGVGAGFTAVQRPAPLQPSPHRRLYVILWSLVGFLAVVLAILAIVQRMGAE